MILMEFDKAGAEWVLVAYLSGEARMLDVIKRGVSPHVVTGNLITGVPEELIAKEDKLLGKVTDPDLLQELRWERLPQIMKLHEEDKVWLPRSMTCRQCGKKSNHGLNYGERYKGFALINEIQEGEAKIIVDSYHLGYPAISKVWWAEIKDQLKKNRTLVSLLGRKIELLDEWGDDLFRAAYSFDPQGTIGDMVNDALILAEADRSDAFLAMDMLTQTHDSATVQYPTGNWKLMAEFASKFAFDYMSPELETRGRKFRVKTDMKIGLTWGDYHEKDNPLGMKEVPLKTNIKELAYDLEKAWDERLAA